MDVVALDARRYAFHSNKRFLHWDLSRCPLPRIRWPSTSAGGGTQAVPGVSTSSPPSLVHMRDVLQHLRYSTGMRLLRRVFESGAAYLVGTTFPERQATAFPERQATTFPASTSPSNEDAAVRAPMGAAPAPAQAEGHAADGSRRLKENRQILDGNFFLADLQRPPFSLPPPIRCVRTHPALEPDLTCLWRLDKGTRDTWLRQHGARVPMPKVVSNVEEGVDMVQVG